MQVPIWWKYLQDSVIGTYPQPVHNFTLRVQLIRFHSMGTVWILLAQCSLSWMSVYGRWFLSSSQMLTATNAYWRVYACFYRPFIVPSMLLHQSKYISNIRRKILYVSFISFIPLDKFRLFSFSQSKHALQALFVFQLVWDFCQYPSRNFSRFRRFEYSLEWT
jgi:hypothetical protein